MKSSNYFLFFDIYSKSAGFYYNNQERIGSYFGLFLTCVYVLCSIFFFTYNFIMVIKRQELNVYDSTIYSEQIPSMNINSNNLYFAFGLEDPIKLNRFIDETVYYPQILYIDRIKINGEFQTVFKKSLEYERCKEENFGTNFQHFFSKNELNGSYCLKDFNYNLTMSGGYKYDKMTYIRIKIFPCKNSTENNYLLFNKWIFFHFNKGLWLKP